MKPWNELTHFAGLDWAKDRHDVVIVDKTGAVVANFGFEHSAEGWDGFRKKVQPFPALAVAIETNQGPVVEKLLEMGLTVYPLNPKSAERYRERHTSSGAKSDPLDAWSFGNALRTDGHGWRPLLPDEPLTQELRLLCRDEVALIEQRTALVNQLQAALHEYYPAALAAFGNWTAPSAWAFLEAFPTPQVLAAAGRRKWEKFSHEEGLNRHDVQERRFKIFAGATQLCGSPAVTAAKSMLVLSLVQMLRLLDAQLDAYRGRIEALFQKHPDHDIFGSLPCGGGKLGPRILSEIGDQRNRFESPSSLQCMVGTAPVTFQSGGFERVRLRRACNMNLRTAFHLWANLTRTQTPWAEAYYRFHRNKGSHHSDAVRRLANRWIKIIWKMWQTHTPYIPELHQGNQIKHGSWVLKFQADLKADVESNPALEDALCQ
jgi:transposase